jgi:diaminopimelate epimerase
MNEFVKSHGLGNDYFVLDGSRISFSLTPGVIRLLCDRNYGIGSDGILLLVPSSKADFGLRILNPDGSEAEKSGNGLRIFARYLWDRRLPAGPDFTLHTSVGPVVAHVLDAAEIALEMGRITFASAEIPLVGPPPEVIEAPIVVAGRELRITAVGIGNPHCVVFVDSDDVSGQTLAELAQTLGPELERLPLYPHRTNVQFVQVIGPHDLRIAIWERGAGYTLASGSSSCAAAAAAFRLGLCDSEVTVHNPGGDIQVMISQDLFLTMTGPVARVFHGEWEEEEEC